MRKLIFKNVFYEELERRPSSEQYMLIFQQTWVQSPAPISSNSQPCIILVPRDLSPSSNLGGGEEYEACMWCIQIHEHVCFHVHTHIHTQRNKSEKKSYSTKKKYVKENQRAGQQTKITLYYHITCDQSHKQMTKNKF